MPLRNERGRMKVCKTANTIWASKRLFLSKDRGRYALNIKKGDVFCAEQAGK